MSTPYSASIIVSAAGNGQAGVTISPGGLPGPSAPGTYYLDSYGGTDDAKMTAALAALFAASPAGGTIVLAPRAYNFALQSWATAYSAGVVTAVKIQGAGVGFNGAWGAPEGVTTCTFTYAGSGAAMMDFQHIGSIEFAGIQFRQANTGKPFFLATNASPVFRARNVWSGGGSGIACATDAIILGGTGTVIGGGDTAPFQGYQAHVSDQFFDGIRSGVTCQTYANAPVIENNTWSVTCGSDSATIGAITIAGTSSNLIVGGRTSGNLIESAYYPYPVYVDYAIGWLFDGDMFYDPTSAHTLAYYNFASNHAQHNTVIVAYATINGSVPGVVIVKQSARLNNVITAVATGVSGSTGTLFSGLPVIADQGLVTNGEYNGVPHLTIGDVALESGNHPTFLSGTVNPNTAGNVSATGGSMYWYRSTGVAGGSLFLKSGSGDEQWYIPGTLLPVTTKTSSYALGQDDGFVIMNGSSLTATLLAPSASLAGKTWVIINENSSALTVAPASGTINGAPSISVAQYASCQVMTDGTSYYTF